MKSKNNLTLKVESFNTLIKELHEIQKNNPKQTHINKETKNNKISLLIDFFKEKHTQKKRNSNLIKVSFFDFISGIKGLYEECYTLRYKNAQNIFKEHINKIQFTAFELMEHDFRENTHSNILQYLFNYDVLPFGSNLLSNFLTDNSDTSISELILKNQYEIVREYPTKNGRIDVLILDRKNKFIIVIENKLLAKVAIHHTDENDNIKTQLDEYYEFISSRFEGYKKMFVLLSLKNNIENISSDFITKYYSDLLPLLEKIKSDNKILKDYIELLKTITSNHFVDKNWMLSINKKLKHNEKINSLNTIEVAQQYLLSI